MVTCPDGHQSSASDYCDVCGTAIGAVRAEPVAVIATCPACGAPSAGRFCEVCGHDSALPAPPAAEPTVESELVAVPQESVPLPPGWVAVVTADREFYERVLARKGPDADQVDFPGWFPERRIPLSGTEILIGKRSVSQGLTPDIDLSIAPADAGVSRAHAMLRVRPDGLSITDLGSTNGTSLNGSEDLIPARVEVPLQEGDRIHLGGWTTIVVRREPS